MSSPLSFRDVELLSAYLDGQLSQDKRTRLESRLKSEPQLRNILDEMGSSRSLMGMLPLRKSPRNFILTAKMAGIRPPLPRAFPIFRFASVFAAFLFIFVFMANLSVPVMVSIRSGTSAFAPALGGTGGGGVKK